MRRIGRESPAPDACFSDAVRKALRTLRSAATALSVIRCILLTAVLAQAVTAQPQTAPLVVMNLAAHPDDEDGATLAYYRHARDAVAYSVIFTRGEGGQNEIGPELYEELGVIRTEETERAARHLGTQVFFLNFRDFGFSKSAEETFEAWGGRDEVTADLVYMIRKLKPDVLFTNHDTITVGPGRQHGHHQAVGISAYDAFELAADASYRPEQLDEEGIDLWQPQRLFRRLWAGGASYDVAVPIGDVDPAEGISYGGMAARALREHASQGMEAFAVRVSQASHTYFELYRSAAYAPPTGSDLAAGLPENRSARPGLGYWIDSGRLASLPSGALAAQDSFAIPGRRLRVTWRSEDLPERPVRLRFFGIVDTTIVVRDDSAPHADLLIPARETPTIPRKVFQYERRSNHPPIGYVVRSIPEDDLISGGYVEADIAPAMYLEPDEKVVRLGPGSNDVPFTLRVYDSSIEEVTIAVGLARDSDRSVLDQHQLRLPAGPIRRHTAVVRIGEAPDPDSYTVSLSAMGTATRVPDGRTFGRSSMAHPATAEAFVKGRVFDAAVAPGLRVGVIESYDNTLDRALAELGVEHEMLDASRLASGNFDDLHTIVVDIRAYLVREDLRRHNDRLLDWVRQGGHLVVTYQRTAEWNMDQPDPFDPSRNNPGTFAPYPLQLGRDRVTREDAPVTMLIPDHPLLQSPNSLHAEDWDGWVQERGLYFPSSYDDRYAELFSLNDPGEEPHHGSTLLTHVGDGTYLYTALVWYRQLKEFHPGAYRAFANMISLPFVDDRSASP